MSATNAAHLPVKYLRSSSDASVDSFQLSRINAIANLRKELHDVVEEWIEAEVQARMAQWIRARGDVAHVDPIDLVKRATAGPKPPPRKSRRVLTTVSPRARPQRNPLMPQPSPFFSVETRAPLPR